MSGLPNVLKKKRTYTLQCNHPHTYHTFCAYRQARMFVALSISKLTANSSLLRLSFDACCNQLGIFDILMVNYFSTFDIAWKRKRKKKKKLHFVWLLFWLKSTSPDNNARKRTIIPPMSLPIFGTKNTASCNLHSCNVIAAIHKKRLKPR